MKYSNYYKTMLIIAALFLSIAILLMKVDYPGFSALAITLSFIFWFSALMAPEYEKYKK